MVARPEIESVKTLRAKKLGINSFGSWRTTAAYAAVSRSGMIQQKLTILAIGGALPQRLAAVVSGSVDATVITSPAEYGRREAGLRVIMSARLESAELVRIPITASVRRRKKWKRSG